MSDQKELTPNEVLRLHWLIGSAKYGDEQAIVEALRELHVLGVGVRGSINIRGTFVESAQSRFPTEIHEYAIVSCLRNESQRRNAILVLGEWGGSVSVEALAKCFALANSSSGQAFCLSAMGQIGGRKVIETLLDGCDSEHGEVQTVAINALSALVLGQPIEETGPLFGEISKVPTDAEDEALRVLVRSRLGVLMHEGMITNFKRGTVLEIVRALE